MAPGAKTPLTPLGVSGGIYGTISGPTLAGDYGTKLALDTVYGYPSKIRVNTAHG